MEENNPKPALRTIQIKKTPANKKALSHKRQKVLASKSSENPLLPQQKKATPPKNDKFHKIPRLPKNRILNAKKAINGAIDYINKNYATKLKKFGIVLNSSIFYLALAAKETTLNPKATEKDSRGYFQIRSNACDDINRILKLKIKHSELSNPKKGAIAGILYFGLCKYLLRKDRSKFQGESYKKDFEKMAKEDIDRFTLFAFRAGANITRKLWVHFGKPKYFNTFAIMLRDFLVKERPHLYEKPEYGDTTLKKDKKHLGIEFESYIITKNSIKGEKIDIKGLGRYRLTNLSIPLEYVAKVDALLS